MGILYKKARVVEISTNGFYTDRILSLAHRYPKAMFRVSLEGLPALNDRLRGTKNGFDHALRTMFGLIDSPARDIGFSVVICDKNADDLVTLYKLCVALESSSATRSCTTRGTSTRTTTWWMTLPTAVGKEREFIQALLLSQRDSLRMRMKDYLRAYFNLNILNHLEGKPNVFSGSCIAGTDLFFVDPWGNVAPCNGSGEEWVMGNIKTQSFDEIMNSEQARRSASRCTRAIGRAHSSARPASI